MAIILSEPLVQPILCVSWNASDSNTLSIVKLVQMHANYLLLWIYIFTCLIILLDELQFCIMNSGWQTSKATNSMKARKLPQEQLKIVNFDKSSSRNEYFRNIIHKSVVVWYWNNYLYFLIWIGKDKWRLIDLNSIPACFGLFTNYSHRRRNFVHTQPRLWYVITRRTRLLLFISGFFAYNEQRHRQCHGAQKSKNP